jgi:hypothetical protein
MKPSGGINTPFDQRRHDSSERRADDDGNGEVKDVAPGNEVPKLFYHRLLRMNCGRSVCALLSKRWTYFEL